MKAELVPDDGGRPIVITRDITVVGRREYCDIRLDHPSLSKRHAVLIKTDGLLILRDLVSTNGTKVKGQRIRWAALLPDDRIAFGAVKFRVYLGPDDQPAPSERPRPKAAGATSTNGPKSKRPSPGFAPPTPLGTPVVPGPAGRPGPAFPRLDDDDLLIEDDTDGPVEIDDADLIDSEPGGLANLR